MSDQDRTKDNLPKQDITRRATLKLATAVAAFGAAMGMRANSARAEGKVAIKEGSAKLKMTDTKSEGSFTDKQMRSKQEGGSRYIKLNNNRN